jgi:hypothetical protein
MKIEVFDRKSEQAEEISLHIQSLCSKCGFPIENKKIATKITNVITLEVMHCPVCYKSIKDTIFQYISDIRNCISNTTYESDRVLNSLTDDFEREIIRL